MSNPFAPAHVHRGTGRLLWPLYAAILGCSSIGCGGGVSSSTGANVAPPTASASAADAGLAGPASSGLRSSPAVSPPPPASLPPVPMARSLVATTKKEPSWAACLHGSPNKTGDLTKDVSATAQACEAATHMKPVGKTIVGKQSAEDKPQTYPLAAKGQHCYRAYGRASDGIKDLDIAFRDSTGIIVGEDATDDANAVAPQDGAVCFTKDDDAYVVVSVGMGSGTYGFQIWGD